MTLMRDKLDTLFAIIGEVRKEGRQQWRANCPVCGDTGRHLYIKPEAKKILVHCAKNGCGAKLIMPALGMTEKDLFIDDCQSASGNGAYDEAIYDYNDADGKLLYQAVKQRKPDGKKTFKLRQPDGTGDWAWNLDGIKPTLYRLPETLQALAARKVIIIPEGEKDVDTLCRIGLAATCNPMGAGKWNDYYSDILNGADVVIIPDDDKPGRDHAARVALSLQGKARSIKMLALPNPGKVKGWDITDWVEAGGSLADIEKLLADAQEYQPIVTGTTRPYLETITAADLMNMDFPEPKWAIPGIIPQGLTIFAGRPKTGKSWLMLGCAVAVASGGTALGRVQVEQGDVLYFALEDGLMRLKSRLQMLVPEGNRFPARLHLITNWARMDRGGLQDLIAWLDEHPETRMVVIDTWQTIAPPQKGHNQYAEEYGAARQLQQIATGRGISIVVVHHTRKASADYALDEIAGTTGLSGSADTPIVLRQDDKEKATLYITGRDVERQELALTIVAGVWTLQGDAKQVNMSQERRAIIDLLGAGTMTPREIADATGKRGGTVRKMLSEMVKAGSIEKAGERYRIIDPRERIDFD